VYIDLERLACPEEKRTGKSSAKGGPCTFLTREWQPVPQLLGRSGESNFCDGRSSTEEGTYFQESTDRK